MENLSAENFGVSVFSVQNCKGLWCNQKKQLP